MANYYSDLKVIFSQLLVDGQPLNRLNVDPVAYIRSKLDEIEGFEFFSTHSSMTKGEHSSSNLVFLFSYYKNSFCEQFADIDELLDFIRSKVELIAGISFAEIRIEFTRKKTLFQDLEHEILYKNL